MAQDFKYIAVRDVNTQKSSDSELLKKDKDIRAKTATASEIALINSKFSKLGLTKPAVKLFAYGGKTFPVIYGDLLDKFYVGDATEVIRIHNKAKVPHETRYSLSLLATDNEFIKAAAYVEGNVGIDTNYTTSEGFTSSDVPNPSTTNILGAVSTGRNVCAPSSAKYSYEGTIDTNYSENVVQECNTMLTHGLWKVFIDGACGTDVGTYYSTLASTASYNAVDFFNRITKQVEPQSESDVVKIKKHYDGTTEVDEFYATSKIDNFSVKNAGDEIAYGVVAPFGFMDTAILGSFVKDATYKDVADVGPAIAVVKSNEPTLSLSSNMSYRLNNVVNAAKYNATRISFRSDVFFSTYGDVTGVPNSTHIKAKNIDTVKFSKKETYRKDTPRVGVSYFAQKALEEDEYTYYTTAKKIMTVAPVSAADVGFGKSLDGFSCVDEQSSSNNITTESVSKDYECLPIDYHDVMTLPYGELYVKFSTNGISAVGYTSCRDARPPSFVNSTSSSFDQIQTALDVSTNGYQGTDYVGSQRIKSEITHTDGSMPFDISSANEAFKNIAKVLCKCASYMDWNTDATKGNSAQVDGYAYHLVDHDSLFQYNKASAYDMQQNLKNAFNVLPGGAGYAGTISMAGDPAATYYREEGKTGGITEIVSDPTVYGNDTRGASSATLFTKAVNWTFNSNTGKLIYTGSASIRVDYPDPSTGAGTSGTISPSYTDNSIEEEYPSSTTAVSIKPLNDFIKSLYSDIISEVDWTVVDSVNSVTSILDALRHLGITIGISTSSAQGRPGTLYGCKDDFAMRIVLPSNVSPSLTYVLKPTAEAMLIRRLANNLVVKNSSSIFDGYFTRPANRWHKGNVYTAVIEHELFTPTLRGNWTPVELTNTHLKDLNKKLGYAFGDTVFDGDNVTTKAYAGKATAKATYTVTFPDSWSQEFCKFDKAFTDNGIFKLSTKAKCLSEKASPTNKVIYSPVYDFRGTQAMLTDDIKVKVDVEFGYEDHDLPYTGPVPYNEVIVDSKFGTQTGSVNVDISFEDQEEEDEIEVEVVMKDD